MARAPRNGQTNSAQRGQRGLRGRQGAPGKTGERGAHGATGKTGARGARGPRGERGPPGTTNITRAEFGAAVKSINANIHGLQVQFQRIAQMQAELDELKRAMARLSERIGGES